MTTNPDRLSPSEYRRSREGLSMESSYLLLFDFDGTMFQTFEPSPKGVGIEENYENTLVQMFGPDILATYKRQGGLGNRAPGEVISDLLTDHPEVVELAKTHLANNRDTLVQTTPETVHLLENWDDDPTRAATEVYIRQDLLNSLDHIGLLTEDQVQWPRPTHGFTEVWQEIQELNSTNKDFHIDTGIVSSAYVEYMKKVFKMYGLVEPDIWVTDDQMRAREQPIGLSRRAKPAPLGIAMAHQKWLDMYGLDALTLAGSPKTQDGVAHDTVDWANMTKERIFYFGDSIAKDAKMAERSHIGFGHYDPTVKKFTDNNEYIAFNNWHDIVDRLIKNKPSLKGAVAIKSIMTSQSRGQHE